MTDRTPAEPNTDQNDDARQRAGGAPQAGTAPQEPGAAEHARPQQAQPEFKNARPSVFNRPNTDDNDAAWQRAGGKSDDEEKREG